MRFRLTLLLTTGLLALSARDAGAWPPGGVRFERPDPSNGIMGFGPDGQGGTYAAWPAADAAGVVAFRIHRLDANGNTPAGWTSAGVRVLAPAAFLPRPQVVPDGGGGVYLTWFEYPDTTVRVGHLAADGSLAAGWTARGQLVSNPGRQSSVAATEDGSGGVLLVWSRIGSGATPEIVTQRFLAEGTRAPGFPAAGRVLTTFTSQTGRFHPRLVRDANRGFWVSFHTVGTGPGTSSYSVLRLGPDGTLAAGQPANGLALSLPSSEVGTLSPFVPVALALDGAGGVFAFTLGGNGNVRAFHVLSSTAEDPAWPAGGLLVAGGAGWPSVHFDETEENWPVATGDLAGGAWVGWRNQADFLVHATRVKVDGTIPSGWASPILVAGEMTVTLLGDASGLYASALAFRECPHFDCYGPMTLARFDVGGTLAPGWPEAYPPNRPAPGIAVGTGGPQNGPVLVDDGAGGVFVGWNEYPEYYAMRFNAAGPLVGVPPAPAAPVDLRARFDPAAGVRVRYSAGGHAPGAIELFDLAGRRVASARVTASSGEITLSGTRSLASGVFLVRLTAGAHSAVAKLVALR
jgi:hypothetical protein